MTWPVDRGSGPGSELREERSCDLKFRRHQIVISARQASSQHGQILTTLSMDAFIARNSDADSPVPLNKDLSIQDLRIRLGQCGALIPHKMCPTILEFVLRKCDRGADCAAPPQLGQDRVGQFPVPGHVSVATRWSDRAATGQSQMWNSGGKLNKIPNWIHQEEPSAGSSITLQNKLEALKDTERGLIAYKCYIKARKSEMTLSLLTIMVFSFYCLFLRFFVVARFAGPRRDNGCWCTSCSEKGLRVIPIIRFSIFRPLHSFTLNLVKFI